MSTRCATAVAHANIALAKYWGKLPGSERLPAVPSLSVTLDGMTTTTRVAFDPALDEDAFVLAGAAASEKARRRVTELLDRVREASGLRERARVESRNDFPTAAGLASSASGFAALALAAASAAGLDWDTARISDLARRSSVSAARSLFGGFVELDAGRPGQTTLAARPIAPPDRLPLRMIVAVATEAPKEVGSTEGMRHTEATSPYYPAWIEGAPAWCAEVRAAILAGNLVALGEAAERSALRMHAAAIAAAPALLYWTGTTVELLAEVRRLRARGLVAYATIDAGPHVKVITRPEDEPAVARALAAVPGVVRTIATRPGAGARLVPGSSAP